MITTFFGPKHPRKAWPCFCTLLELRGDKKKTGAGRIEGKERKCVCTIPRPHTLPRGGLAGRLVGKKGNRALLEGMVEGH